MAATTAVLPADVKRAILIRQIGFLIGLAASVAVAVYVALWAQTPSYGLLYGSLSSQDVSQVLESLQKAGIDYRVDDATGAVLVPSSKVHEARLKLAADGLPENANVGFGMLNEDQGFGTSQFLEQARYQHALETELAQTVEKVSAIRTARVHLALPRQSSFVRDKRPASASVFVSLYSGHGLEPQQVAAIANLVAASVPNLDVARVSIIDQQGRLLTDNSGDEEMMVSARQFQYIRTIEQSYVKRIEDIIRPIVGINGVKAQVAAEVDFTHTEQTRESYNPDRTAIRSEQIEEQKREGNENDGGVPGALSNQPPAATTVTPAVGAGTAITVTKTAAENMQRRATRNYELDKTISHTRKPMGTIRRLSVAVLVDYKRTQDAGGNPVVVEHSPEELEKIAALVRDAIGYDAERGDRVSVMHAEFVQPGPVEPAPALPIWKQAWLWDVVKQVLGGAVVLFLVFGVLRPSLKNLASKEISLHQAALSHAVAEPDMAMTAAGASGDQLPGPGQTPQISPPRQIDTSLESVRGVVQNDPKLAAQVVKNWVGDD